MTMKRFLDIIYWFMHLLGRVSERRRIDPLVDVDILDNGYNMGSDDHLHFSSNEFQSSWVTLLSDREYIVSDLSRTPIANSNN